ncbi:uncharacterized protein LOC133924257 [Phragmites australis]|uniref:uncharacterized protein LOC133924257 n=1 Tax=Phragmites australis TaxID=29695 RepID=UPI002D7895F4|nr:uncharacterized protein LOC133924257 [Phragmites australis]
MGDLTFPATAATPQPAGPGPLCRLSFAHLAASPLWFPPSPTDDDAMAEEEQRPEAPKVGGEAAADEVEDRMDLLWEDFNEELGGSCCDGLEPSSSDAESERFAPHGCAPVLRPSSRAGGAGHYRRRAGSWVLLMRIFRRLFVIDKTISAAARQHATRAR